MRLRIGSARMSRPTERSPQTGSREVASFRSPERSGSESPAASPSRTRGSASARNSFRSLTGVQCPSCNRTNRVPTPAHSSSSWVVTTNARARTRGLSPGKTPALAGALHMLARLLTRDFGSGVFDPPGIRRRANGLRPALSGPAGEAVGDADLRWALFEVGRDIVREVSISGTLGTASLPKAIGAAAAPYGFTTR